MALLIMYLTPTTAANTRLCSKGDVIISTVVTTNPCCGKEGIIITYS